jgi:release factor glutamine methyltransferase
MSGAGPTAIPGPESVGGLLRRAEARLRAAGIATARQDAEILLARALGATRLALHVEPGRPVEPAARARLEDLLARRGRWEPLQYIVGEEEFLGLTFAVGPGVFVPRPETALLVERAVAAAPEGPGLALDLGAGSAAVACALAARRPALAVVTVELSPEAAAWARRNVRGLGLEARVTVLEGDLFAPIAPLGLARRCDLVVANPPYIPGPALSGLPEEVRAWEPVLALDGGADGLALIGRILDEAPGFVRPGGRVLLELGHDQAPRVRGRVEADPRYGAAAVHRDLRGHERVLEAEVR